MSLRGTAFLALWNDFDPARDDEYNRWHTFEHVPERVGIEGVFSGRRYVARERTDRRYFTLYELADLQALNGASYLDVVERPTKGTLGMRSSFRNFFRQPCTTEFSAGQGHGAAISTYRTTLPMAAEPGEWERLLRPIVLSATAVAVHAGRVDTSAKFPGQNAAPPIVSGVPYVMMIEGTDREQVTQAERTAIAMIVDKLQPIGPVEGGLYDLALVVAKSDLADPGAARQPPRPDLRNPGNSR